MCRLVTKKIAILLLGITSKDNSPEQCFLLLVMTNCYHFVIVGIGAYITLKAPLDSSTLALSPLTSSDA